MSKKRKLPEIVITELFLVKADWQRTFMGTIRRETDVYGNPVVMGEVIVQEGKIWSKAANQEDLIEYMDGLSKLKLDHAIHSGKRITQTIFGIDIFFN